MSPDSLAPRGSGSELRTGRLVLRPVAVADAAAFHELAIDPHVRRYLLDGQVMSRDWAEEEIAASRRRFARGSLGLWLAFEEADPTGLPIGFAGFRVFDEIGPEPQLVYAFREVYTGRGYATETAETLIEHARAARGWTRLVATVDAPNTASLRVLEKLGFQRCGELAGAFGAMLVLERR